MIQSGTMFGAFWVVKVDFFAFIIVVVYSLSESARSIEPRRPRRSNRRPLWRVCRVASSKNSSPSRLWCHIRIKTASSMESAVISLRIATLAGCRIYSWHHGWYINTNRRGTSSSTWRSGTCTRNRRSGSVWWNNRLFGGVNAHWRWVVVQRWIDRTPRAGARGRS